MRRALVFEFYHYTFWGNHLRSDRHSKEEISRGIESWQCLLMSENKYPFSLTRKRPTNSFCLMRMVEKIKIIPKD
jgi:hypothetical protein